MTKQKKKKKFYKSIPETAQILADQLIAQHGIKSAEQIAKLTYEKVVASRRSLERRYGNGK